MTSLSNLTVDTPETLAIKEDYPDLDLLEMGDISVWIQTRYDQLGELASENQINADTAKFLNLFPMVVGGVLSTTTPVGGLIGLCGLGGYLWTIVADAFDTGHLHPIPLVRKSLADLISQGDSEERELRRFAQQQMQLSDDTLEELRRISYLPREQEVEARMLFSSMAPIVNFLEHTEPGRRYTAYRWLITEYKRRGNFNRTQQADVDAYTKAMLPNPDVDYAEIARKREGRIKPGTHGMPVLTPEQLTKAHVRQSTSAPSQPVGNLTRLGLSPAGTTVDASALSEGMRAGRGDGGDVDYSAQLQAILNNPTATPIRDRANLILEALKAYGCDIHQFVGDQMMGATGTQRSGKTTLLMILTILEKALTGKGISYITVDDDVYPVAFDTVISGMDDGINGYEKFLRELPTLRKGQAKDNIWFLDECTKALNLMGKSAHERLWNGLTTGFLKSRGSVRMVMHGETAAIMGIPDGYVAQVKDEATFIKALRKRDDGTGVYKDSGKYPSGKYLALDAQGVTYSPTGETFQIPDWLLLDSNEDEEPCYVRTLLRYFPEYDTRVNASKPKPEPHKKTVLTLPHQDANNVSFKHKEETSVGLPGLGKDIQSAADLIARHLQRNEGKEVLIGSTAQAFAGRDKENAKPYLAMLCEYLVSMHPGVYIKKRNAKGADCIYYQRPSLSGQT